jgi:hypothetical protein
MQGEHVGDGPTGVLLSQGIVTFRQQALVQYVADSSDPNRMKIMKDSCFNTRPVMHIIEATEDAKAK